MRGGVQGAYAQFADDAFGVAGQTLHVIALGSLSRLKAKAALEVSATLFPTERWRVETVRCDSQVPETPWDSDTLRGAESRAQEVRRARPDATFAVGLESGLVTRFGEIYEEAWACVLGDGGLAARGYSSGLLVPPAIISAMRERGSSHAELLRGQDGDPDAGRDTWSLYTNDKLSRLAALTEAMRNAMVLFAADGTLSTS